MLEMRFAYQLGVLAAMPAMLVGGVSDVQGMSEADGDVTVNETTRPMPA
jgi:hypothetical protein